MVSKREIWGSLVAVAALMVGLVALALAARFIPARELPSQALIPLMAIFEASLILPPWFIVLRRHRGSWSHLGFRRFNPLYLVVGGVLFALSLLINLIWGLILIQFNLEMQPEILPLFGEGKGGFVLALTVVSLIAPLAEEAFFRGFLFAGLKEHYGLGRAMLFSALIFTLFHLSPTSFLPIFFLGCFLALLYHLSGSLWPSVLMHATMNTLALTVSYLSQGFPRL